MSVDLGSPEVVEGDLIKPTTRLGLNCAPRSLRQSNLAWR